MELTREILAKLPLALRIEIEENVSRKDFSQSELAALQESILAEVRQHGEPGRRTDLETSGKNFPKVRKESERATQTVGRLFGESGKQVQKRIAIVNAAKDNPEKFGKIQADMDRTGRVSGPFMRLRVIEQAEEIRKEPPPLPGRGPYRVIVSDPPWPYEIRTEDPSHRAALPYASMSIQQICAMNVASLAHEDCLLWLWTTNCHIFEAAKVLDAWGFAQKTMLTWVKPHFGCGEWLRGQTEHCLMATRGRPTVELTNQSTVLHAPVRKHSQKPVEFYDFVESLCPAPRYTYLFSRYRHNEKWDCHGDEAPEGSAP